jgi:hypothetical protein
MDARRFGIEGKNFRGPSGMKHAFKFDFTIGRAVWNEPHNVWAAIEGSSLLPLFLP